MKRYEPSELIINEDNSIFHLHIKPEQLADRIILVGDPGRVDTVASHFDSQECSISNREFHTITGLYKGKRITVLSTGIGCDNIDITMNELDALANIDFMERQDKPEHRTLTIVRIGTCGGLQPDAPLGTFIASVKSIGFDGLLNYYAGRNEVCDLDMEHELVSAERSTLRGYSRPLPHRASGREGNAARHNYRLRRLLRSARTTGSSRHTRP